MSDDAIHFLTLKDVAEARLGFPFRGAVREVPDGDVAVVQIKNIDPEQGVHWPAVIRTVLTGRKHPDWLQPGDVLFIARGNRNVGVFVDETPGQAVCAPQFYLLRVTDQRILPAYLAWYLNQAPAQRYFAQAAEGTLITSIRRAELEALPVPVPSIERQKIIAKLGDAVRRERELTLRLIQTREQQIKLVAAGLIE